MILVKPNELELRALENLRNDVNFKVFMEWLESSKKKLEKDLSLCDDNDMIKRLQGSVRILSQLGIIHGELKKVPKPLMEVLTDY